MASNSISRLAEHAENDPELRAAIENDPVAALRTAAGAYTSDPTFYRMAIGGLILIVLVVLGGGLVTELWAVGPMQPKKSLPDGLLALGTTALGGLVGLFAPSPTAK